MTVLVTVNSSYFLTINSVKRVMGGMWLNDEVPKYYYLYCFYEIIYVLYIFQVIDFYLQCLTLSHQRNDKVSFFIMPCMH